MQEVTVNTDRSTLLRFLGWAKAQSIAVGALDCSIFAHERAEGFVEDFATWAAEERQLSYGTIGTYLNSLLSCANFTVAHGIAEVGDGVLQALYNLRCQVCCTYTAML